ncbi:hypothetical protein WJX84_005027 [Apatococcus fuscideae]|uniref:Uncharacterized protein n=1 Tax=Apatococcus fuscideae TaxID=2026836 RepID=A0AAW1T9I5_9CHLO
MMGPEKLQGRTATPAEGKKGDSPAGRDLAVGLAKLTVPRLKLADKDPVKIVHTSSDSPPFTKSSKSATSHPRQPVHRPGAVAAEPPARNPAGISQQPGGGRVLPETKTPAQKGASAIRDADGLGSPDYVPGKGDGASPSLLHANHGRLACQTAIGRRREGHGEAQGVRRFGDWYTGTEAELERDLAELAAHKEASRAAAHTSEGPLACAPFSSHAPGQGMGKEVGAMLRDLAEKADRELQELQANLEEGSSKVPAHQQPLQQRLIESWQGKSYYDRLRELAAEAGGPGKATAAATEAAATHTAGSSTQPSASNLAHRSLTSTLQHSSKDKENKPAAVTNSARVLPSEDLKPPAKAARKVGFATDKQDATSRRSMREATPAAKKGRKGAASDEGQLQGSPEILGAAESARKAHQVRSIPDFRADTSRGKGSESQANSWQVELEAEVSSMQATIQHLREHLESAKEGQAEERARLVDSRTII